MTENNQAQFPTEGEPAFPVETKENDNSAESPTVEKQTNGDQSQSQGGNEQNPGGEKKEDTEGGFADHPRWKERETNWTERFNQQEQRHLQEISKIREEIAAKAPAQPKQDAAAADGQQAEMPEWFGGNEESWKQYNDHTTKMVEDAVKATIASMTQEHQQKTEQEQKAIEDATTFFNTEVTAIEADKALNPEGRSVDRNKLLKTAQDNDLVDSKGQWNYKAAFKLMKPSDVFQAKKAMLDEKKELASATQSENRAEQQPSAFRTPSDFKGKGWGDL